MIVVEGPDGAGKSRLAEFLSTKLDAPIAPKAVNGDAQAEVSLKRYVEDSLDYGFHRAIFDRHALISSPIYTSGLRKPKPNEGFNDFVWLSTAYARWRELAPTVIICLPPFDTVRENCKRDEQNRRLFRDRYNVLFSIYNLYFNLAARNPAMVTYDYTRHKPDLIADYVQTTLEVRGV